MKTRVHIKAVKQIEKQEMPSQRSFFRREQKSSAMQDKRLNGTRNQHISKLKLNVS